MAEFGFRLNPAWAGSSHFPEEPAFTNFLNADLRETSTPSLDPRIFGTEVVKSVFEGKAVLQLVACDDISRVTESDTHCGPRCLRIRLSDGFSEVVCVEQSPVSLSVSATGKVLLIGPVTVRRGVVLLNSCNLVALPAVYPLANMSGGCEFEGCSDSALFTCLCNRTLLCSAHLVKHVQERPEQPHCPVPGLYKACGDLETYLLTKQVEKHQIPALDNSLHERERLRAAKDSLNSELDQLRDKVKAMFREYLTGVKDRFLHCSAAVELEIGAKRESIRKFVAENGWKEDDQLFVCKSIKDIDEVKHAISSAIHFRLVRPSLESSFRNYISAHKGDLSDRFLHYLLQMDKGDFPTALDLVVSNAAWFGHLKFILENLKSVQKIRLSQCEDIGDGVAVLEQHLPAFAGCLLDLSLEGLSLTPDIFGQLTEPLSSLSSLQSLSLKGNRLRDEGMTAVASLLSTFSSLQSLNLASNVITFVGAQAIAQALPKTLVSLDLSLNRIGNQGLEYITQSFPQLPNLAIINLSDCNLKPSMDDYWTAFGQLWNLHTLDLSNNTLPFTKLLPVLSSVPRLSTLKLANTGLVQPDIIALASAFASFQSLELLDISKAVIGNDGSSALALYSSKLKGLKKLNLTGCQFDKEGIVRWATGVHHMESLEELIMANVAIGREGGLHLSSGLSHLATLKVLNIAETALNEDGGAAIMKVVKHMPLLETLIVRDNPAMGDSGAIELSKSLPYITQIRILDLWNCGFQPEGVSRLSQGLIHLTNIETLVLGQNEVGLAGIKALNFPLAHLSTLKVLNVVGCMLGSQGALHLALSLLHLSQLTELYLTSNNFGNEGVGHLGHAFCFLTSLQKLSISENHFGRDALFKLCRAMAPMSNLREFCLFSNEFGVHQPRSILTSIASRISMSYVELQDYNIDDLQRELQAALPMVETIT